MPKNIIGTFTMRDEGDGCLTSKHLEESDPTPFVECCKRISDTQFSNDVFEGDYTTCWIEPAQVVKQTTLGIRKRGDSYDLVWGTISGISTLYVGKAMISEGKLVGVYWDK